MTDALANLRKLPEWCYAEVNGEVVVVARGASTSLPSSISKGRIDTLNLDRGVSRVQRLAMEAGLLWGWNHSAADPDNHAEVLGYIPEPARTYTVHVPLDAVVEVEAHSVEEALVLGTAKIQDLTGDAVRIDGRSWVSNIT